MINIGSVNGGAKDGTRHKSKLLIYASVAPSELQKNVVVIQRLFVH